MTDRTNEPEAPAASPAEASSEGREVFIPRDGISPDGVADLMMRLLSGGIGAVSHDNEQDMSTEEALADTLKIADEYWSNMREDATTGAPADELRELRLRGLWQDLVNQMSAVPTRSFGVMLMELFTQERIARQRDANERNADDDKFFNELMCQAPVAWDGEDSINTLAIEYVHALEERVIRLGGTLERYEEYDE